jgi:SH3-like domain-containing protein
MKGLRTLGIVIWIGLIIPFAFSSFAQEEAPTYRDSLVFTDVVTIKDGTNLRSGPATQYSIAGKAVGDEKYDLLSKEEKWSKIRFEGVEAWVRNTLVESFSEDTTVIKIVIPPPPIEPTFGDWVKGNPFYVISIIVLVVCLLLILRVVIKT